MAPKPRTFPACLTIIWIASLWLASLGLAGLCGQAAMAAQEARLGTSGLPLPRFVSLKSSEVNLRTGPGKRYPIDWIFRRRGLPVEVIDEFEDWRRVRDHDGTVGWVHRLMLVSRRTVLITGETRTLRRKPEADSRGLAYLQAGVIAELRDCRKAWCRIEAQGFEGWLHRSEIFGTNADD